MQDHLQIHCIDGQGLWSETYKRLYEIENSLNQLDFSYLSRFGYLTADPGQSGTALTIRIFLHLPALLYTKQLEEIAVKQQEEAIAMTSLDGRTDAFIGDLVVLYNRYTLGLSEEHIAQSLHTQAMKWMAAEKTFRSHLMHTADTELKDSISRSLGLLLHSYQLQTRESLDGLSLIKLGLDLGWVEGIDHRTINRCLFQCRRAHLAHLFQDKIIDIEELPRKRAEFLHEKLKQTQLNISS